MPPNGSGSTPASMSRTIDSLKTLRIFVTRSSADLSTYATIRRRSQDFSVPFLDCDVELFMRSYIVARRGAQRAADSRAGRQRQAGDRQGVNGTRSGDSVPKLPAQQCHPEQGQG